MKPKPRFLGPDYASQFQDEAVAAVYRQRPPYPDQTFELLAELLPKHGPRLLDVGSGTGEIAIPMAARGAMVDAVEASAAMLDVAQTRNGSARVSWHNVAAEAFVYPASYDLITCAQCLGWLDWAVVFPKFARALSTDGWLVIVEQHGFDDFDWQSDLLELISRYSTNQDFEPFRLVEGLIERGLFALHGAQSTEAIPFEQTIGDYIDSIHARNGFSRDRMAPEAASAFDQAVRELLNAHHPDGRLVGENSASVTWGKPLG